MAARFRTATALVGTLVLFLSGCAAPNGPTYADVRAQAESAVGEIVATLPEGATFAQDGEIGSDACDADVAPVDGPDGTAFATVHGTVTLPAGADAASLVEDLPAALGDGWAVEPVGVDVDLAAVRLNQARTGVSADVTETTLDRGAGLDLLIVSGCGLVE